MDEHKRKKNYAGAVSSFAMRPQNVFEIFRQLPIVVGYLPLSLTCYLRQF